MKPIHIFEYKYKIRIRESVEDQTERYYRKGKEQKKEWVKKNFEITDAWKKNKNINDIQGQLGQNGVTR